jgi:glycosyltransferase involved in cell wall biosynthesis
MRIAVVHDWLVVYAGAERVLEQMLSVYPDADIFSLIDFLPDSERFFIRGRRARTSWLQRIPGVRRRYRQYLPVMPLAVASLDVSGYDVVISSSHAVAKAVRTRPEQLHICMCYSPMRYAWDLREQYLREAGLDRGIRALLAHSILDLLRDWDRRTSARVDAFIAISQHIARRIRAAYNRESTVIYPPVDVAYFTPGTQREHYYVTAARLVPYKRIDLIAEAFRQLPDRRLVIIGDGPELAKVRARAGDNVLTVGRQPGSEVRRYLQRARAFIHAAVEDFGIAPLEAQACGTPVVAYGAGALAETVWDLETPDPTGILFHEQSAPALVEAIRRLESCAERITPQACRRNAMRFAPERFRAEFATFVEEQRSAHAQRRVTRPSSVPFLKSC